MDVAVSAELRMFGPMTVVVGDRRLGPRDFGGRKAKQVLEILALENRVVSKDELAARLWDDNAPRDTDGCLEHYVSLLRRQLRVGRGLAPAMIRTEPGGYRLDSEHVWIDVAEFDAIDASCVQSDDRSLVGSALELMSGDLLEDEPFAEWALQARSRYRERKLRLACIAGELALREGDFDAAVDWGRTAASIDTLNESSHRCLMLAYYARGERGAALRVFAYLNRALVDELGVEAMRATTALHAAILNEVPAVELLPMPARSAVELRPMPTPTPTPASTPTPALTSAPPLTPRPAFEAGAPGEIAYLGRHAQLAALRAACTDRPAGSGPVMVLVEGGSGFGKSRFLDEAAAHVTDCVVRTVRCVPGMQHVRGALVEDVVAALTEAQAKKPMRGKGFCNAVKDDSVSLTAVHELEQHLAAVGRFVVMIDDAHSADAFSIRLLSYLTERGQGVDGAFVLTLDDEQPHAEHPRMADRGACRIRLGPLTEADLEPLRIDGVYASTGGLPVAVAAHVQARAGRAAEIPRSYRDGVIARVRALGEDVWRVAVASAITDPPCTPSEVSALLGAGPLDVAELQDRLCAIGVLQPATGGYAFRFPLLRTVLRDTISPTRRRLVDQVRAEATASPDVQRQRLAPMRVAAGSASRKAPRSSLAVLRPTQSDAAGTAGS